MTHCNGGMCWFDGFDMGCSCSCPGCMVQKDNEEAAEHERAMYRREEDEYRAAWHGLTGE